jgi:hypothetical protein
MNLYQQQQTCAVIVMIILSVSCYSSSTICIDMVGSFGIVPKYMKTCTTSFTSTNDVRSQKQQQQQRVLIDRYQNDRHYKSLLSLLSIKDDHDSKTSTMNDPDGGMVQQQQQQHRKRMGELTKSEQTVYDIINELVQSNYTYRIVVMGGKSESTGSSNGVILECTVPSFGPLIKILQSPSTGMFFILLNI